MSDDASVARALRSSASLVVVEAPAGCGKTFQGAEYARDVSLPPGGRLLVLTHTHAAQDVFAARIKGIKTRVELRTIDSLIVEIAAAYHAALVLPPDPAAWARAQKGGYELLAAKVAAMLSSWPAIARAVTNRYPVIVCDEHQDANEAQHSIIMSLHACRAKLRIFGDPMQSIFGGPKSSAYEASFTRWEALKSSADEFVELETPHRWAKGSEELGAWILAARQQLKSATGVVDLRRARPREVSILLADNNSARHGGYAPSSDDAKAIRRYESARESLLILSPHNDTVHALRAMWGRRFPIWEGHVRDGLSDLAAGITACQNDPRAACDALLQFLKHTTTGFTKSQFGGTLSDEVASGCSGKRSGKPATLQSLGRHLIDSPDHRGVALVLDNLRRLIASDPAFAKIHIDHPREFFEGIRLGEFENVQDGVTELAHRRSRSSTAMASKTFSTVHKSKGLEADHCLVVPCDAKHFGGDMAARCRLYVAMSRARKSLAFVVPRNGTSPLIRA